MDSGTAFALGVVSGAVIIGLLAAACRERPVMLSKADEAPPCRSADPDNWWARGEESPYGPAG